MVTCISLTSTPKSILNIYNNPLALRLVLFFNIVAASLPAVLVTLNYEYFEIISHEVEYLNELTMSFVDLVLLWSLCQISSSSNNSSSSRRRDDSRGGGTKDNENKIDEGSRGQGGWKMAAIACVVALVQLAVYNGMGITEAGDMIGEVPAHYLEFSFGIVSSLIAFWFCMDNKVSWLVRLILCSFFTAR